MVTIAAPSNAASATAFTLVRNPIDEERDMPRLFLKHHLEEFRQFGDEEFDAPRQSEDPEAEKRVDAFFICEIEDRAL